VLMAACGAAIALAMLVRSWEREWPGLSREPGEGRPAGRPAPAPAASGAGPDRVATVGDGGESLPPAAAAPVPSRVLTAVDDLRSRSLTLPVHGVTAAQLQPSFEQARGERRHEAIDILAPSGTPVFAVESGRVAKLFVSDRGGLTIYQFDPLERYAYYYAHLSKYADGLQEGGRISRGEVIGYVGVSGNAPPDAPHLHFAIFELGPEKRWWQGAPIDPFLVWRGAG
jgi:peptidoglycan LD-endopeptidase LytH